jgi:hypothetical protein
MRHMYGETMATRRLEDTGNMVAVFVRHDNGIKLIGRQTQPRQPLAKFALAEAAIEQHPGTASLDHQRIAATTAA